MWGVFYSSVERPAPISTRTRKKAPHELRGGPSISSDIYLVALTGIELSKWGPGRSRPLPIARDYEGFRVIGLPFSTGRPRPLLSRPLDEC